MFKYLKVLFGSAAIFSLIFGIILVFNHFEAIENSNVQQKINVEKKCEEVLGFRVKRCVNTTVGPMLVLSRDKIEYEYYPKTNNLKIGDIVELKYPVTYYNNGDVIESVDLKVISGDIKKIPESKNTEKKTYKGEEKQTRRVLGFLLIFISSSILCIYFTNLQGIDESMLWWSKKIDMQDCKRL